MSSHEPKQKRIYNDVSLTLAFAEVLMSVDIKKSVWELRFIGLKQMQAQLTRYAELGYDGSLLEAISEKKSQMILQVSSKTELDKVIHPRVPHYEGNKFFPDVYNIPEEELICWCETLLRAPLNQAGYARYMQLFRQIFPEESEQTFGSTEATYG